MHNDRMEFLLLGDSPSQHILRGVRALLHSAWTPAKGANDDFRQLITKLHDEGCLFFATFGKYASSMHDTIDAIVLENERENGVSADGLTTTFHVDENPEDAADFFLTHCRLEGFAGDKKLVILDPGVAEDNALRLALISRQ